MDDMLRQRFASQMSQGSLVLFTGAGFSLNARNRLGNTIPSVTDLRAALWPIAFPDTDPDDESTLGEVYHQASKLAGNRVKHVCTDLLTVDPATVPPEYETWLSSPWFRIYTVNVDDLEEAASHAFTLPRRIRSMSALTDSAIPANNPDLMCIHLNGRVGDYPDMTFSERQYGERTARPDPWYQHLVADISNKPVLFVGTNLDEPPLWQHLELRGARHRRSRELRPGSYLVAPHLSVGRRAMLRDLNIEWIPMSQEEFASSVLEEMAESRAQGMKIVSERVERRMKKSYFTLDSLQLAPGLDLAEYLMGIEPRWEDIAEGYAVEREFEQNLTAQLEIDNPNVCIITGTAGSGKTTTLMRIALKLRARGKVVAWLHPEYEGSLREIRREILSSSAEVIIIDDADQFGRASGSFLAELANENPDAIVIASVRSTRYDDLELERHLRQLKLTQFTVPHLEDSDITLLLDVLERAGRLGRLRGMSRPSQERAFREVAGRQLIVAMVEATSGERFDEKIDRECGELGMELGLVYAVFAVATNLRHFLYMDESLLAIGDASNEALNHVQALINQKLVIPTELGGYQVRHRYIADRVVEYFKSNSQLGDPMRGLLFAFASKVLSETSRKSREWQLLIRLLNHEVLMRLVHDAGEIRECYEEVEGLLSWDYHFWLQRGCFEVKSGDLRLAQNFIEQARSLEPNDFLVRNEWSYMMLKRAHDDPTNLAAQDWAAQAFSELEEAIQERGSTDSYPYHVYGSQGLAWARRAIMTDEERVALLDRLRSVMNEAVRRHSQSRGLQQLRADVEAEYLEMSLPPGQRRPFGHVDRMGSRPAANE
jgi:hypothetical protein